MSAQILLISALITFVACGIMFFYFKNRIAKTEQKVDLMFQLIQEHQRGVQMQTRQFVPRDTEVVKKEEAQVASSELIDISDTEGADESENYDSDDSDEVSDGEDDRLQISTGENLASTNKIVSLTLDGAETGHKDINMSEVTELTEHNLDEDLEHENMVGGEQKENDSDVQAVDNSEGIDDNDELDTIELSEAEEDVESIEEDVQKKVIEVESPATYQKMNMTQLKAVAETKGLSNYKGLRKQKLVELLSSS